MFEHVGTRFYDTYFGKCRELLKPDGVMLMHTIGLMDGPWYPNPWLDKYIFPGGQLPALSEIMPAIERAGLIVTDVECLRLHYAETLRANGAGGSWRAVPRRRRSTTSASAACGNSISPPARRPSASRTSAVFQVQCARRQEAVPMTRDYIAERMQDLRIREVESEAGTGAGTVETLPRRAQRN